MSEQKLKGKIAFITGASRGIGRAIAIRYAKEGAHVILLARSKRKLERVDDAIKEAGGTATLVTADILDFEKLYDIAASVAERFGPIDILVGNAAILGTLGPIHHVKPDEWDKVMATNLTANWHLMRAFDPLLRRSKAPRAIYLSSGVTKSTHPFWSVYAVSKHALDSMVQLYAAENAQAGLKVNLVDPGATRTDMLAQARPGDDMAKHTPPEVKMDTFVELAEDGCQLSGQVIRITA